MKDDIKEILDNINNKWEDYKEKTKQLKYVQDIVSGNDFKQLLDYIINLQDRIKELEQINEEHRKINGELRKTINEAIEYINISLRDSFENDKYPLNGEDFEHLLNILQGGDE